MAAPLSADTIISQFEESAGDSIDQVSELFYLNEVKDTIEAERNWSILKALKKTDVVPVYSGNAMNSPITLPTDFALPSKHGIYVANDRIPYEQAPFESQIDFQDLTYAYFLDVANNAYALTGTPTIGQLIYFFYNKYSPTMALVANGGSPWVFPARFHPLLVYEMLLKYFPHDQGDKGKSWDDRWSQYAQRIRENMYDWDDALQMDALQNEQNFNVNLGAEPNIIDMGTGGPPGSVMYG
jgi:hypothetical protein